MLLPKCFVYPMALWVQLAIVHAVLAQGITPPNATGEISSLLPQNATSQPANVTTSSAADITNNDTVLIGGRLVITIWKWNVSTSMWDFIGDIYDNELILVNQTKDLYCQNAESWGLGEGSYTVKATLSAWFVDMEGTYYNPIQLDELAHFFVVE